MKDLEVIRYIGDNNTLVHKYSCDDLTTRSQLIVNESQEAVFYKSGQALDLFGPGRHDLKTENLPIIKKVFSAIFGGGKPFPCEVFFVNKVDVLDVVWGTDAPIDIKDPEYPIIIGVRANGQTGIRVTDSRRFVVKVVGQLQDYTVESIRRGIKGMLLSSIKECISQAIVEGGVSVVRINSRLSEISSKITALLNDKIADLGIEVNHFSVNSITYSDDDAAELRSIMDVDKEKRRMEMLGYNYHDERQYDILEGAATNQGTAGGFIGLGLGLGVGTGVGNRVGNMMNNIGQGPMANQQPQQPQQHQGGSMVCPSCNSQIPQGAKFCMTCGQKIEQAMFCPQCGSKCAPGSKFCMNCGNKLM